MTTTKATPTSTGIYQVTTDHLAPGTTADLSWADDLRPACTSRLLPDGRTPGTCPYEARWVVTATHDCPDEPPLFLLCDAHRHVHMDRATRTRRWKCRASETTPGHPVHYVAFAWKCL